jgi:hypothetical protein
VIGQFKKLSRAQNFGEQYCQEMDRMDRMGGMDRTDRTDRIDRTDRFIVQPVHLYCPTLVFAVKSRFLSLLEGQEAKNQIATGKYSGDIKGYSIKMKWLNNLGRMLQVTSKTTIERQLSKKL